MSRTTPAWLRHLGLLLGLITLTTPARAAGSLAEVRQWAVYYGAPVDAGALQPYDLVVVEPDNGWDLSAVRRPGQRFLAYLSLGEVNTSRPYYPRLAKAKGAVVGPNRDWAQAMILDPRQGLWRELVLGEIVPGLLAKGFDGFFFDTLDVAADLERGGKHPGAAKAMAELVLALHQRHPQALLLANGGQDLWPLIAPALSGLATESVVTDYQFKTARYQWRERRDADARQERLIGAGSSFCLPTFVIEYVDPADAPMRRAAAERARAAGLLPYVADIGLSRLMPPAGELP